MGHNAFNQQRGVSGFTFETTPRIVCSDGAANTLGTIARECGITRALVVTDRGLFDSGIMESALQALRDGGVSVVVFCDVLPDPPEAVVLRAAQHAVHEGVNGVIGIGGGSSLDTAKLAALLATGFNVLSDIYGVNLAAGARLPLIQVPTTAGTGSEVTPIAIVTTPTNEKQGVVSRLLYPDVAVLDALLTVGLPARVTAMTGIDAMVHAIEAYTSRHRKNLISDTLATAALRLLSEHLPRAIANGADIVARRAMLQGSMLAGMAFANAPVAAVHALAYPLGGHFHVPHGLSNALVLVPVLEFNQPSCEAQYAELCHHMIGEHNAAPPSASNFVRAVTHLVSRLGLERRLRDVGVREEHLAALATDAMKVQRLLVNNPREVTYNDALGLYRRAL